MGTTTLRGLPYPNASDPVADGDNAIAALAQDVDEMVQADVWSTGAFAGVGSANTKTQAVVFAVAFAAAPAVQVSGEADPANVRAWASNVTAAGFTLNAWRAVATGTFDVHWTATARSQ